MQFTDYSVIPLTFTIGAAHEWRMFGVCVATNKEQEICNPFNLLLRQMPLRTANGADECAIKLN